MTSVVPAKHRRRELVGERLAAARRRDDEHPARSPSSASIASRCQGVKRGQTKTFFEHLLEIEGGRIRSGEHVGRGEDTIGLAPGAVASSVPATLSSHSAGADRAGPARRLAAARLTRSRVGGHRQRYDGHPGDGAYRPPAGPYLLFVTEMWERFSYYGMRALLVLYLLNYLQFQPEDASAVYKWYTGLVYLTPLLGGFLADRFLGLRAVDHHRRRADGARPLPRWPSSRCPSSTRRSAFLIVGNGFFKPNISTMVGKLYRPGRSRGATAPSPSSTWASTSAPFLAPLVCGWLRQKGYGFHYGFAAAGVGMVLGLVIFLFGQKHVIARRGGGGQSDGNDASRG